MEKEMILCIDITAVLVPYEFSDRVVLDGGGHVHYNKCKHGKEVYPNKTCGKCHSGNRILEPQRLKKAIDKVENKGFRAIAFMGFLTIKWARDHPDKLANDGTKTFNDLLNQGKIIPVGKKREDVWWLSYALDEQAYIFTNDNRWVPYEQIQADIFDHLLAAVPEFDLGVFQTPSGRDLQTLGKALKNST